MVKARPAVWLLALLVLFGGTAAAHGHAPLDTSAGVHAHGALIDGSPECVRCVASATSKMAPLAPGLAASAPDACSAGLEPLRRLFAPEPPLSSAAPRAPPA